MINALIDEKENYAAYESVTRPINNKDEVEKYVSIAKNLGLGDIVEIECFDNIRLSVFSAAYARKNENVISYNSGKGMTREQAKMSAVMELYVFRILFNYLHLLKNGKLNMSPRMKIVNGILIFVKL